MFILCKMKSESIMCEGGGAKLKITVLKSFNEKPNHIDIIQSIDFSKDIEIKKEEKDPFINGIFILVFTVI